MKHSILYLGSGSQTRKRLLLEAKIPFHIVGHTADEQACTMKRSVEDLVAAIAQSKMAHVVLPDGVENDECFVLTADTLCVDNNDEIHGKPIDRADAIQKIRALSGKGKVLSAFCLDKKRWVHGDWQTEQREEQVVVTEYELDVPESMIAWYLDVVPHYADMAGGLTIEGFGAQFLKSISGSYTNILGLPMFELREALQRNGFAYKY